MFSLIKRAGAESAGKDSITRRKPMDAAQLFVLHDNDSERVLASLLDTLCLGKQHDEIRSPQHVDALFDLLPQLIGDGNNDDGADDWEAIPEFGTLLMPVVSVLLIVGYNYRRKNNLEA